MIFQNNKKTDTNTQKGIKPVIDLAKVRTARDRMGKYYSEWKENTALYEGRHWEVISKKFTDLSPLDKITVNYPFSMIFTMLPGLYYKNPYVFAVPQVGMELPDVREKIALATAILNVELQDLNKKRMMKEAIQLAILDSLICNFGVVKVGYLRKKTTKRGDKSADTSSVYVDEDSFFVDRIDPLNVVVDPEVKDLHRLRWVAVKYRKHFKELKEDKSLNQKAVKQVINDWQDKTGLKDQEPEYIDIYEVWDKDSNKFSWVYLDGDVVLKTEKSPYDFFPYKFLVMYMSRERGFGLSLIGLMKSLIVELDVFRSKHITVSRKASNVFIMRTMGKQGAKVKEALRNAKDMDVVEIPAIENADIRPLEYANNNMDIDLLTRLIKQDLQETGAIPDFEMGVTAKTKSATEAAIMSQVSQLRKGYLRDRVADFVKEIVNAIAKIIKRFYATKRTVHLKLSDNVVKKFTYDGSIIPANFSFDIDVNSMQYVSPEAQAKKLLELLTIYSSNPLITSLMQDNFPVMVDELTRLYGFDYLGIKAKTVEELQQEQQQQQAQQMTMMGGTATPQDIAQYNEQLQRQMQAPM